MRTFIVCAAVLREPIDLIWWTKSFFLIYGIGRRDKELTVRVTTCHRQTLVRSSLQGHSLAQNDRVDYLQTDIKDGVQAEQGRCVTEWWSWPPLHRNQGLSSHCGGNRQAGTDWTGTLCTWWWWSWPPLHRNHGLSSHCGGNRRAGTDWTGTLCT